MLPRFAANCLASEYAKPLRALRRWAQARFYASLSRRQAFRHVYKTNAWGGPEGEIYSGLGSNDEYGTPYAEVIRQTLRRLGAQSVVDLGCGDFRVGSKLLDPAWTYVGVDLVDEVIEAHRRRWNEPGLSFERLDICEDELPAGDVAIIRQVLQHLSNEDILAVLPKLKTYSWILVTEHLPDTMTKVNLDKPSGPTIRAAMGSGVLLHAPPFDLPTGEEIFKMEVQSEAFRGHSLVTYLYDLRNENG